MKIKEVIGIDVSKLKLDCYDHHSGTHEVFDNTIEGIGAMVAWGLRVSGAKKSGLFFVFEHAGLYTYQLVNVLSDTACMYAIVPGLEIKRSLGITRGKDDKVDAKRIAQYGYRMREEIEPARVNNQTLNRLKSLMSLRRKLVSQRAGHRTRLGEQLRVLNMVKDDILFEAQRRIIKSLDAEIQAIEEELNKVIKEDPDLQNLYRLVTSVKGIGPVTAVFLIVCTGGFTKFSTWRKFACYCGIAPFPYTSGSSVRGRTGVNHFANKELKTLLSMCSTSAIQYSLEMKRFYKRRIEMGKNKKSTINIVRNKLLARVFAVVNRGVPYVDTMGYAA
ncbi:IS110 family transposase [Flavivirga sp. 57AJ16]|uniref:IS110 family transposase n=1 Tax=Flavivirga sp. 57AJ16 TaxID=3025307 RepID=UPI00236527E6|nr:IS110 family transposase [Flavivirga sp. 57AJ16]MDD7888334.1 IS110 family transposase [Flavivirga sp. 57AJ16]